ncbi:hypothetical protein LXL04_019396 [Taraxacum kok-saghyz]
MADNGNTGRQKDDDGGHDGGRPNPTTPPSPSRTPRRPRRNTSPPKHSPGASSSTMPAPPTPPAPTGITGASSSSAGTNIISFTPPKTKRTKSVICPICKKDMCHEKALCGHIRWHTQEERLAASIAIARALSSNVVVSGNGDEDEGPSKKYKLPDLNKSPPPEEEEDEDAA